MSAKKRCLLSMRKLIHVKATVDGVILRQPKCISAKTATLKLGLTWEKSVSMNVTRPGVVKNMMIAGMCRLKCNPGLMKHIMRQGKLRETLIRYQGLRMRNPRTKILDEQDRRRRLLARLFVEAADKGIDEGDLRDVVAPGLIQKRLSEASPKEIYQVLEHIAGKRKATKPRYESSLDGLRREVADLARERFGEEFERPLNAFCRKFGIGHYRWLNVACAKVVRERLKELQAEGPYKRDKV